jgi:uncharacterized protein (TIGR00251 family)
MQPEWWTYDPLAGTLTLTVYAQPNARTSGVAGIHGDALKIRIAAPALDNKANDALLSFVAGLFRVPAKSVVLIHGNHGRRKILEIRQVSTGLLTRLEEMSGNKSQGR